MLTLADIGEQKIIAVNCVYVVCVHISRCFCASTEIPVANGEFQELFCGILQAAGIFSEP